MTGPLDEIEIWSGRPTPRRMFGAADLFFVPLSLFFTAGSMLLVAIGAWSAHPVMATFYIAFSLYMLVGRFGVKYLMKKATSYKLTNQRALVFRRNKIVAMQDVEGATVQITESLSQKYATASFNGNAVDDFLRMPTRQQNGWLSENTGLEAFSRVMNGSPGSVRFFDLTAEDAKRLQAAARTSQRRSPR